MDNNKVFEILNKYYGIDDTLNIILEMAKEPFDKEKESILEYFQRKIKPLAISKITDKSYRIYTGFECHEHMLLNPLVKYINENFSNIYCNTDIRDSDCDLIIAVVDKK